MANQSEKNERTRNKTVLKAAFWYVVANIVTKSIGVLTTY